MSEKIKNFEGLATTEGRRKILSVAEAGFMSVDTVKVIGRTVVKKGSNLTVGEYGFQLIPGKIHVVGIGKCANEAVSAIAEIIGDDLAGGIAYDVKDPDKKMPKIEYFKGTHPFPSDGNIVVTGKIVEYLKALTAEDLLVFVVSGGGSTLLCMPSGNKSCSEEEIILKKLFASGATIQEINTIRKHTSLARGGYLARYAHPAQIISLIFSDVPGNDPGFVASGPTIRDESTAFEAESVLSKYDIFKGIGISGQSLIETPKEDKYFENVRNIIVVSNDTALNAMAEEARRLNLRPTIKTNRLSGEASAVGEGVVTEVHSVSKGEILLYGGETTVTTTGSRGLGLGGRNAELALSALQFVGEGEIVAAFTSDGRDNSDYAGAIADRQGLLKSKELGLNIGDSLARHDSLPFFEKTGDYIYTGPTGSNVSDLIIGLKE